VADYLSIQRSQTIWLALAWRIDAQRDTQCRSEFNKLGTTHCWLPTSMWLV
jgi:hypothetical protein